MEKTKRKTSTSDAYGCDGQKRRPTSSTPKTCWAILT